MKILIVDDSLLAEHALKSYFLKLGHEVIGLAKNGEMAKKMIAEKRPDLITVDAIMPGMHGLELIKHINNYDRQIGKNTFIFMISSDTISDVDKSKVKVDKYMTKPITMAKIKAAILTLS